MSIKLVRCETNTDVEHFLSGGITGGVQIVGSRPVVGLHGLTLEFTNPVGTVSFSDPTGAGLYPKDIKTQIEADVAALKADFRNNRLQLIVAALTSAVKLKPIGTANAIFGFSRSTDTNGTIYNGPAGAAPKFLQLEANPTCDGWTVVLELP